MSESIENKELNMFYNALNQEVASTLLTDEEGGTSEQIFTQLAVDLLVEAGETENIRLAYDERGLQTKNQLKINAYSISDNYETIDLFITIYKGSDNISKITSSEVETAGKRIFNFFKKAIYKEYVNEIEESSDIFQFAHTLSYSEDLKANLVRVNAIILTNGHYVNDIPKSQVFSTYNIYFRVIDVVYLHNISQKSHILIELDFQSEGFEIPCIEAPSENEAYKSYLAIMPAAALANIYERFGARLLEQNVRSFLQFSGKINKGIRNTILKEPEMFLAFNNGIAATAEEIELGQGSNGLIITKVSDLQIVNGGQTTASIYHTWKKDKAEISHIYVQLKLTVVKNKENFGSIVSRIAEYANTQNKVSIADLSSNKPYHIEFEKLSRSIYTPHTNGRTIQTKWFYERARGQYKNARLKDGFTKAKQKQFDLQNPKNQVFTKEELAKYINAYKEVSDSKKILIGPHFVVQGNQKNYLKFILHNLEKKSSSIYFEDCIAKAILFKSAEKVYGVKPNAIGDMRYVTVPYTISLLNHLTDSQLDLYHIWKAQSISEELKTLLYKMMVEVEAYIKQTAPGGLFGEWAKKEDCWTLMKEKSFQFDFSTIHKDFIDKNSKAKRVVVSDSEVTLKEKQENLARVQSIPPNIWLKIEEWGRVKETLTPSMQNIAFTLAGRIRNKSNILDSELANGLKIIDLVIENVPELFFDIETEIENEEKDISIETIAKIVAWDKKNRRLKDFEYRFMLELAEGWKELNANNKKKAILNLEKVQKWGFL